MHFHEISFAAGQMGDIQQDRWLNTRQSERKGCILHSAEWLEQMNDDDAILYRNFSNHIQLLWVFCRDLRI